MGARPMLIVEGSRCDFLTNVSAEYQKSFEIGSRSERNKNWIVEPCVNSPTGKLKSTLKRTYWIAKPCHTLITAMAGAMRSTVSGW